MEEDMTGREERAVELLTRLCAAVYTVQCESNGIWDNGWRRSGEAEFDWELECPITSFTVAMERLGPIVAEARGFLDPVEAAKNKRWRDACATAGAIVGIFNAAGATNDHAASSLQRNIADAINGSFVVTMEDARSGRPLPETMDDKLEALVPFYPSKALDLDDGAERAHSPETRAPPTKRTEDGGPASLVGRDPE